ncbi:MAG TPA: histidine phosphatase family protein [Candidatus Thermoplasmatota archaeon]|nr:histidine phosphatase family protein [Candidatus Thermoplasmatota archaeon]
MDPTRLWFLRHGEIEERFVGTILGSTDVGLSPLGRHQAEAVKEYLKEAPLDAIVASPLRRARDTVAPLAAARGIPVEVRKGFAEMDFGQWDGLTWEAVKAKDGEKAIAWERDPATVAPPGGESADMFFARIEGELTRLLQEFKGRSVVLGGHSGVNRAILAHILKRPYMDCFAFAQDYGCLNAAGWSAETGFGQVALVNFVPGPRAKAQGD